MKNGLDHLQILLVEDDEGIVELIRTILESDAMGPFTVTSAITLEEGRRRIREETFDAVILDLGLPDSRGLATFLGFQLAAPGVPVVILTGDEDPGLALDAIRRGAEDYVVKQHMRMEALPHVVRIAHVRHRIRRDSQRQLHDARTSESYFKRLLEMEPDGMVVVSLEGVVRFVNPAARSLFSRSPEQFADSVLGIALPTGKKPLLDVPRPDGSARLVELGTSAITWKGEPAMLLSFRDVTARRRIADASRLATEASRAVRELTDGVGASPASIRERLVEIRSRTEAIERILEAIPEEEAPEQPPGPEPRPIGK